jgi:chaperonin GroES
MAYALSTKDGEERKRSPNLARTLAKLAEYAKSNNIAEDIEDAELEKIGMDVHREYEIDKKSRADWEASCKKAMDTALQVRTPKNYPFERAANIKYPLVTVAALQFGARAYPAIVDGNRIVKAQVLGEDKDGAKKERADRVSAHMSYQLLHEMEEWEEDTDVLVHHLPIIGCAFRKVYRSEELGRNRSEMIPAIHLVVNNKCRSLDDAPRITHEVYLYPQEIEERQRSGTFIECDLGSPAVVDGNDGTDDDAPHCFLEQHRYLDLDEDGYREPYIVTVHKDMQKVVRIVANYTAADIKHDDKKITRIPKDTYFVKYSFIPDPKGGFYDIGFGKLLESLSETIDTTINQMLDAGHLQNAGGGFIGSGVRLKKGEIRLSPGKYISVEAGGAELKNAIYNFEHPGPSAVLFNLLGMMVDAARDITAVKDILTGDSGDKVQTATTTLAMIEQGLKVFTAIYKRIYRALRDEFALLFKLNARHLEQQTYFNFHDTEMAVSKDDYDIKSLDIAPVADPKMVTDMQRMSRAQVVLQTMEIVPNKAEALKYVYDTIGLEKSLIEKLVPEQQGPSPAEQMLMEEKMADIENTKAATMKTAAEADKIQAESASLTPEDTTQIEMGKLAIEQEDKAERRLMDADKTQNELILAAEKQRGQEQFERDKARVDFALKADRQEKELAIKAKTAARPKVNA